MTKIALSSDENAWRITLSDPPLHILDMAMLEELRDALGLVTNDRHALILDATCEKAFSAGASVQDHLGDRVPAMLERFHDCFRILARLDLVTVALVRGAALGGGCELALACDFVLASDGARFGLLELILTGDPIDAATVASHGLVNAVFPAAGFDAQANEWLGRIYRHSASSLRIARKAFRLAQANDFESRLAEVEHLYLEELMQTDDAHEGLNAFVEKRKPSWRGR
jgi:enoyl-CoA hydratase/carnithine racemase